MKLFQEMPPPTEKNGSYRTNRISLRFFDEICKYFPRVPLLTPIKEPLTWNHHFRSFPSAMY